MLHVVPHLATFAGCSIYAAPRHLHLASTVVTTCDPKVCRLLADRWHAHSRGGAGSRGASEQVTCSTARASLPGAFTLAQ